MTLSKRQKQKAEKLFYFDKQKEMRDRFFTAGIDDVDEYIDLCLFVYGGTKLDALLDRAINLIGGLK